MGHSLRHLWDPSAFWDLFETYIPRSFGRWNILRKFLGNTLGYSGCFWDSFGTLSFPLVIPAVGVVLELGT
jgi:hypothetical protein